MECEIKELPLKFDGKGEVKGYLFFQLGKHGSGYLYLVEQNGHRHYEVFKRKERLNPYTGIEYVRYPNSKAFGVWAWTYMNMEKGIQKLLEIRPMNPKGVKVAA